jgi:cold shock CspA family protein/uncharacterized LabA/DUF88 family protein
MIFVDGTWLYANTAKLAADYGRPDLQIDYGLLPDAVSARVRDRLGLREIDIVRTHLFASYPVNFDPYDQETVRRRTDFFDMLKEEYHYEIETYPIDFRGRRVRSIDRDPADSFEPREKCVDIALASAMLYYAAIPSAYDIAIVIIGDRDYIPVLQRVRRLAKRVGIASIRGSCASEYADPVDHARVKDLDLVWLNDMIPDIELRYERRQLTCQSEFHQGDRRVWTTYRPRKGQPFYCDECRRVFVEKHAIDQPSNGAADRTGAALYGAPPVAPNGICDGHVYELKDDRRFGFLRAVNGREYFFHLSDLADLAWQELEAGLPVSFRIRHESSTDRAGHAFDIRPRAALVAEEQAEDEANIEVAEDE